MKRDPANHEKRYKTWKSKVSEGIPEVSKKNSDVILNYINDMENGINISNVSAKGGRSYARLNNIRQRMIWFSKMFDKILGIKDLTAINEEQLLKFFNSMKNGTITRNDGKIYNSVDTYSKIFKAFWNWHIKASKKEGLEIKNITEDLDTKQSKPKWVYLDEEQTKTLLDNALFEYRALFTFLLDSGVRSPSELVNIKVKDLYNNCKELDIRDEISKTFGRRIKLMLCSDILKRYIESKELKGEDYLFDIKPYTANKYVKRLATKLFGDVESKARGKYSEMSLYDFRHISSCYWYLRYNSDSAMKYRFGWKKTDKIYYYSEFLGMKDTISEEDMVIDVNKTEMQKQMSQLERSNQALQEENMVMKQQMEKILKAVEGLNKKYKG